MAGYLLVNGDARRLPIADGSVHCCITSPPYWGLRDYGVSGQIGLERTPDEFVAGMVAVFREVRRILRDDGTLWLNLGDSYANDSKWGGTSSNKNAHSRAGGYQGQRIRKGKDCDPKRGPGAPGQPISHGNSGLKPKDLVGIPWRVALALQDDGWWLRSEITWCKTSPMPEPVEDRPTSATEKLFLLSKSERYFYDANAVRVPSAKSTIERDKHTRITSGKDGAYSVQHDHDTQSHPDGRNLWNYWVIGSESYPGAHFATYPRKLVEPCVKAGTSQKGVCPECGAPWEREVEMSYDNPGNRTTNGKRSIDRKHQDYGTAGYAVRLERRSSTVAWNPTCQHDHAPVPAIVFDPFCGSATTGVVANALGRRFIGVDLSRDYLVNQASRRLSRPHAAPLRPERPEYHPLFASEGSQA